jgi:hypothetical protein
VRASGVVADDRIARGATRACRIVERGARVNRNAIVEVVNAIVAGELPEIARDRNAICYRAALIDRSGASRTVIVKAPRPGPQRTNADATFAGEASVLARLPAAAIAGAPELLAREMAAAARRTRRIVWLNPMAGWDGYSPAAAGMRAALPHIELFAPAHNLRSLEALEPYLARI